MIAGLEQESADTTEAKKALVGEWYGYGEVWRFLPDGTVSSVGPRGSGTMSATYTFESPVKDKNGWFRFEMILQCPKENRDCTLQRVRSFVVPSGLESSFGPDALVLTPKNIPCFYFRSLESATTLSKKLSELYAAAPGKEVPIEKLKLATTVRLSGKFTPDQIRAAVVGKTKEELIALIGRPDKDGETYWQYNIFTVLHGNDEFASSYSFAHLRHGFFVRDPLSELYFKAILVYFGNDYLGNKKVVSVVTLGSIRGDERPLPDTPASAPVPAPAEPAPPAPNTTTFDTREALDVPPLRGRINDYAGLIPADRAQALEERLARFEAETGNQIVVLSIRSLKGDVLEDFSIRVAKSWKAGKKGFENGVILLIVRDDRKLRLEVG